MEGRYSVRFLGKVIYCDSPRHAAVLQMASDILGDIAPCKITPDELQTTVEVLLCYGLIQAAEQLRQRSQMRADLAD